ncbi:uncharacterized protein LOC142081914 isoform X3 [Calonectris borealis]|uniref:uncharacterized protein LOC142081914 isoform X3 n=1 Tax=Calonectris borealis TaxID=1323832 RepID=UPI003F4B817C
MAGCSEDLLARPRTEDPSSSWASRPPRGKSPDRRQRVPGAAGALACPHLTHSPPRRPRAERVSAGRALVTATDTQVVRRRTNRTGLTLRPSPFAGPGSGCAAVPGPRWAGLDSPSGGAPGENFLLREARGPMEVPCRVRLHHAEVNVKRRESDAYPSDSTKAAPAQSTNIALLQRSSCAHGAVQGVPPVSPAHLDLLREAGTSDQRVPTPGTFSCLRSPIRRKMPLPAAIMHVSYACVNEREK